MRRQPVNFSFAGLEIMIIDFFLSPLPFFLSIILFSLFSMSKFKSKRWAKVGRFISVLLPIMSIFCLYNSYIAKVDAGAHGYHSHLVTKFTKHIEELIENGECKKAEIKLKHFNEENIFIKNMDDLEELISKLLIKNKGTANQSFESDG